MSNPARTTYTVAACADQSGKWRVVRVTPHAVTPFLTRFASRDDARVEQARLEERDHLLTNPQRVAL